MIIYKQKETHKSTSCEFPDGLLPFKADYFSAFSIASSTFF